jgi:hypothetical protein
MSSAWSRSFGRFPIEAVATAVTCGGPEYVCGHKVSGFGLPFVRYALGLMQAGRAATSRSNDVACGRCAEDMQSATAVKSPAPSSWTSIE